MKLKNLLLVAVFVSTPGQAGEAGGELAQLHSFTMGQGQVTFAVTSHGCTQATDFSVDIDAHSQPATLQLMRHREDRCRRMPFSKTFSLAVPGLEKGALLRLDNVFVAPINKVQVKAK